MIEANIVCLASIVFFLFCLRLQHKTGHSWLNPLLICLLIFVPILMVRDIPYDNYMVIGHYISYLIEPAVVALGFPLYMQLKLISREWRQLILVCLIAVLTALTFSVLIAKSFGMEEWVIKSLATLCITTAIAMETSEVMGGSAALAAVTVMIAGIGGSTFALPLLQFLGIRQSKALGLAIGCSAHALGTATIARTSHIGAAYSSTALILCAILTALIAPLWVPLLLSV